MNSSSRVLVLAIPYLVALAGCSSERSAPEQAQKKAPEPAKITHFYANPGVVARGEPVNICYGVTGARSVRMEPPVEALDPSLNRCVQATPKQTTKYTLIATGEDGKEVNASVSIQVQGRAASRPAESAGAQSGGMIGTFAASADSTAPGRPVTLCYTVSGASSVSLSPPVSPVKPGKACFMVSPQQTSTYTLKATGPGGSESQSVTITVK